MTAFATGWPDSPLDAVDTAFVDLTCDPDPLSLDLAPLAGQFGDDTGLPGGVIALPALRQWLLEHPRAYMVRADPPRPPRRARLGDGCGRPGDARARARRTTLPTAATGSHPGAGKVVALIGGSLAGNPHRPDSAALGTRLGGGETPADAHSGSASRAA